ncbi:Phosphatidylinositol-3-phosphatase myotubularin-1-like protein [Drosera capensis]
MGLPTFSGSGDLPFELIRQPSAGSIYSSPGRQQSASLTQPQVPSSSAAQTSSNCSPIFLQWIDCVSQLLRMYPFAFEFSSIFVVDLLDCMLSCRFGNFLCNSEQEREQSGVPESCGCLWVYLANLRASGGQIHVHYNLLYDPVKHEGPLLPPAAALSPTIWPQFHLRWACPEEVEVGDVGTKTISMANKLSDLHKAKDIAERKNKELLTSLDALTIELRNEKCLSNSAMNLATKATKESDAIKRAVQSLGCKINFSSEGRTTVDIDSLPSASPGQLISSPSKSEPPGIIQRNEKSNNLSVSLSVMPDDNVPKDTLSQLCESLCPFPSRDGYCRWPEAGCAQVSSQFVSIRADYDALDRLSIDDSYF